MKIRRCTVCDARLQRKPTEQLRDWNQRTVCNRTCAARSRRRKRQAVELENVPLQVELENIPLQYLELPILPGQKLSYEMIGDMLGYSRQHIFNVEQRTLAKLARLIKREWR